MCLFQKVWVQVSPNVKCLCEINIKEISYKDAKWEITLTPYAPGNPSQKF